jgi:hypothetical protein
MSCVRTGAQAAPFTARVNERRTRTGGQPMYRAGEAPPCVNHHASRRGASGIPAEPDGQTPCRACKPAPKPRRSRRGSMNGARRRAAVVRLPAVLQSDFR